MSQLLKNVIVLVLLTFSFVRLGWALPNGSFVVSGQVIRPDGTPMESSGVSFTASISDQSGNCVLWTENFTGVDMTGTNGNFSLALGTGTRTDGGNNLLNQIFSNKSALGGFGGCPAGYTPAAGDERSLKISFQEPSSNVQTLSAQSIKPVPSASAVGDYGPMNLMKISGAGNSVVFSPSQVDFLSSLTASAATGVPTCATGSVLQYSGGSWACQQLATGVATSIATGTGLTGGPISSAAGGTISLATIPANTVMANATASPAAPSGVSLSTILDSIGGASSGGVLYRGATAWSVLSPGTPNSVLTQGAGGLTWALPAGTSINVSAPYMVSSGPTGSNGTVALSYTSQSASTVLAAPGGASGGIPSFRSLHISDIQSSVSAGAFLTATGLCPPGQALQYAFPSDILSCSNLAAPGSSGQIQFNSGGQFSVSSLLYWDNTNNRLAIGSAAPAFRLDLTSPTTPADRTIAINSTPVVYLPDQSVVSNSIAVGNGLRNSGTGASYDTSVGIGALSNNASGYHNTAMGALALTGNSNGYYNSAFGSSALSSNLTGNSNVAVGGNALSGSTAGSNNVAIGYSALSLASGNQNIAIGYYSGTALGTGSYNVIIGSNSGGMVTGLNNNIIISDGAGNARIVSNSSGRVGIGGVVPSGTTPGLVVAGPIVGAETVLPSGSTADFSQSNTYVFQSVGGSAITLNNMVAGGSYKLIIEDLTSRMYTLTGTPCTNFKYSPANAATTASTTIFNIYVRSSGICYVDWKTGY
jgi:hypothetical protein